MSVTRKQAEAVLAAVIKRYHAYLQPVLRADGSVLIPAPGEADQPQLVENFMGFEGWHVVWESGPYDWAFRFTGGGVDEEIASALHHEFGLPKDEAGRKATEAPAKLPKRLQGKVRVEPTTSYAIGIYGD